MFSNTLCSAVPQRCPIKHRVEFPSVRLCGKIDHCASKEEVKGLRALRVRVAGPGRALARDVCSFARSLVRSPLFSIGHRLLWVRCPKKGCVNEEKGSVSEE